MKSCLFPNYNLSFSNTWGKRNKQKNIFHSNYYDQVFFKDTIEMTNYVSEMHLYVKKPNSCTVFMIVLNHQLMTY